MSDFPLYPDFSHRSSQKEQMDLPECDVVELENTLVQFAWINRWTTRARYVLGRHVLDKMRPGREYHLVDLGAGACDTAVWLLRRSRARGLRLMVSACDHDSRVVDFAKKKYPMVHGLDIIQGDVLSIDGLKDADFVFANHFLHHLTGPQIIDLLKYLKEFGKANIILSDLKRSRTAYLSYYFAAPLLFRYSLARADGLLSIRKGFLHTELQQFIDAADPLRSETYSVEELLPARLLLHRQPLNR